MKHKAAALIILCLALLLCLSFAAAQGTISNVSAVPLDNTSLQVSWTGTSDDDPLYTVTCQVDGTQRATERRTYHQSCVINYLAPGVTYTINISTASGGTASTTVTMPASAAYTDFNYQLTDIGVFLNTEFETDFAAVTTADSATLRDTLADHNMTLIFKFTMQPTKENKYLDFQLVLRLPNGDAYTISDVLWYANDRTRVTAYFGFDAALSKAAGDYASFPLGDYTVAVYIDGYFAGETIFTMQ